MSKQDSQAENDIRMEQHCTNSGNKDTYHRKEDGFVVKFTCKKVL